MGLTWDPFIVAFVAVGGVLLAVAILGGGWFGPEWWVLAGIGALFVVTGVVMGYQGDA